MFESIFTPYHSSTCSHAHTLAFGLAVKTVSIASGAEVDKSSARPAVVVVLEAKSCNKIIGVLSFEKRCVQCSIGALNCYLSSIPSKNILFAHFLHDDRTSARACNVLEERKALNCFNTKRSLTIRTSWRRSWRRARRRSWRWTRRRRRFRTARLHSIATSRGH